MSSVVGKIEIGGDSVDGWAAADTEKIGCAPCGIYIDEIKNKARDIAMQKAFVHYLHPCR
jgi:hypothetical protein